MQWKYTFLVIFVFLLGEVRVYAEPTNGGSDAEMKAVLDKLTGDEQQDKIQRAREEPRISSSYRRGEYLLYDCREKHFVCVNSTSFETCEERRKLAIKEKFREMPCAPLKKFKTQKECFDAHYAQIYGQKSKVFCLNSSLFN